MDSDQNFPFSHFVKLKTPPPGKTSRDISENSQNDNPRNLLKSSNLRDSKDDEFISDNDENAVIQEEIKSLLKDIISEKKYSAYFENTFSLLSFDGDSITFKVSTPFIRTMIEKHYYSALEKVVSSLFGSPVNIHIKLSEQSSSISKNTNFLEPEQIVKTEPSVKSVKDASFRLDLDPSQDDLEGQVESKYIDHMNDKNIGVNPNKTFSNFVVGPSNHMAYSSAIAISRAPGKAYPSTYFHSASGLGKTHLLHAIANEVQEKFPQLKIVILTARDFMTEMINCLQANKITQFRKKYSESIDVLMIDDIQELKNKHSTQNEFFHVFNELHNQGKQLIFTSDKEPKDIDGIEERIRTRLSWGLVSDIQLPDLETRIAILKKKAKEEDVFLPDDVINLIASAYKNNIRELEGSLIKLGAYSSLFGVDIDIEIAQEQLKLNPPTEGREISIELIAKTASQYFKIPVADLRSKARYKEVTRARHISMYLSYKLLKTTYEEIGRYFGRRDHTSVLHAVEKIKEGLSSSPEISQTVLEIENLL